MKTRLGTVLKVVATVLATCVLPSGCGANVATRSFDVVTTAATNDRSSVPVDFVLVRDPELVPVLAAMRAKEWFFEKRKQMLLDHPGDLEAHRMDFVPGHVYRDIRVPLENREGVALFVFVRFLSSGAHRIRVDHMEHFEMVLGADDFTVRPIG